MDKNQIAHEMLGLLGVALLQQLEFNQPSSSNRGGTLTTEEVMQLKTSQVQTLAQDLIAELGSHSPNAGASAASMLGIDLDGLGLGTQSKETQLIQLKLKVVTAILKFRKTLDSMSKQKASISEELKVLQEIKYQQERQQLLDDPEALRQRIAELQSMLPT